MATNHTTNYQLNLWEPSDAFIRTEFNENSNKIDAALGTLSAASSEHAAQLSQHTSTLSSHTASLKTHDTAIGERLRCLSSSYVGTGKNSFTLNFGVTPKVVIIIQNGSGRGMFSVLIRGQSRAGMADGSSELYGVNLSWSGTVLSLTGIDASCSNSFNSNQATYLYFVFY